MLRGGNGRETASAFQREHAQRRHVLRNPLPLRRPLHLPENRGERDDSCRRNGSWAGKKGGKGKRCALIA